MLQNLSGSLSSGSMKGRCVQAWTRFWKQMNSRTARQAWGLATDGQAWVLVGLTLGRAGGVLVHAVERIVPPETVQSSGDFSQGLSRSVVLAAPGLKGLHMALDADDVVSGLLELPVHSSPERWAAEVQTEVSQLLGLGPEEVSFDFHADPVTEADMSRVHWVGCQLSHIQNLKKQTRAAGWQLNSVEPAWHAAQRAAMHLQGGLASVLTQPTQDWRFDLTRHAKAQPAEGSAWVEEAASNLAINQAMQSVAGPRLVASGLALKAWL